MRGYLFRLAERALGLSSVAQPRSAPLFAPGPWLPDDGLEEIDETLVSPQQNISRELTARPGEAPEIDSTLSSPEDRSAQRESAPRRDEAPSRDPSDAAGIFECPTEAVARPETPAPETLPAQGSQRAEPALLLPERRGVPAPRIVEGVRDASPSPPVASLGDVRQEASRANSRAGDASPSVRVTIGRVEVRAVFPASQPPRPVPAPSGPALKLDEYLKQRREGVR